MVANIKELVGKISSKKLDKVKNKNSEHYGNQYWRLAVELENEERTKEILVFKEWLEQEQIYHQLEQWQVEEYCQKRFKFRVQRRPGAGQFFRLLDWEILKANGEEK